MAIQVDKKKLIAMDKRGYETAQRIRQPHEREMDAAIRLTQPVRKLFRSTTRRFDRTDQYDSTATGALYDIQTMILSMAIPQGQTWFEIGVKDQYNKRIPLPIRILLKHYTDVVRDALKDSGFESEFGQALFDVLGPGTAVMGKINRASGPVWFHAPITQFYLLYDEYQQKYHRIYREHEMTAAQLQDLFGNDRKAKLPRNVEECLRQNRHEEKFKVIEAQSIINEKGQREYWYRVYLKENWEEPIKQESLGEDARFYAFPWQRIPGEPYGDGLVRIALPHIQTANQIRKLQIKYAEFAALGAWQAIGDSVINWRNKKIEAGKIFPTVNELKPLTLPGNLMDLEPMLQREEQAIRHLMLMDIIPAADDPGDKTAYEISQRFRLFVERAGGAALNLEHYGLLPMLQGTVRSLEILQKLPILQDQKEVFDYKVNSIVRRGREQAEVYRNLDIANQIANLAQISGDPTVLMTVKWAELARNVAEIGGMTPTLINREQEIQSQINKMNQQAQTQEALGVGQQALDMMKSMQDAGIDTKSAPGVVNDAINAGREVRQVVKAQR